MTIERHDPEVAIKVVPMYIEGEDQPADDAAPAPDEGPRSPLLGALALGLAVFTVAALIGGIVAATSGDYRLGTILAYGAIGLSVLAVLGGVVAVVRGQGRRAGVIAVITGIVANPLVLLTVLRFLGGAQVG